MGLRKAKGNTFPDVDWLWSPLVCGCRHQCGYCYAMVNCLRFGQEWGLMPHWASENFKRVGKDTDPVWKGFPYLPEGRIFVCDTTDLFANNIPDKWIEEILKWCWYVNARFGDIQQNTFVFCTKNPARYFEFNYIFESFLNDQISFGITLETNRDTWSLSRAPIPQYRAESFAKFIRENQYPSFVSIEPIMDYDQSELLGMIKNIKPDKVYIGADSCKFNLPEPNQDKLISFIESLNEMFCNVVLKQNLNRLLPEELRMEVSKPQ